MGWKDVLLKNENIKMKTHTFYPLKPLKPPPEPPLGDKKNKKHRVIKMKNCFHEKWCQHLFIIDDRQMCRKNNQSIFDIEACPIGNWFSAKPTENGDKEND